MQQESILATKIFFDFLKIIQLANYPINQLSDKKVVREKVVSYGFTNILVQSGTLYDLQEPRYKIPILRAWGQKGQKRAWPKNQGSHGQNQIHFFLVFIQTLNYNIQQELACSKTFPSNIVDWLDYTLYSELSSTVV